MKYAKPNIGMGATILASGGQFTSERELATSRILYGGIAEIGPRPDHLRCIGKALNGRRCGAARKKSEEYCGMHFNKANAE